LSASVGLLSFNFKLERSDRSDILQVVIGAILFTGYYLIEIAYRIVYFIVHFWIVSIFVVALIVVAWIGRRQSASRSSTKS
jgi:hypothetical protein